jgi:hypothetical protein
MCLGAHVLMFLFERESLIPILRYSRPSPQMPNA